MQVKLVSSTPAPVVAMATAAAITRGIPYEEFFETRGRESCESLLKQCYEAGHWSVFEFADFDFEVQGVSRVFETQAVRSRMGSYEWESGRHDQHYEAADIVQKHPVEALRAEIEVGIESYEDLVQRFQIPAEDARYELPQGVARMARIKKNFRALIETAEHRMCSRAQKEYRDFMGHVSRIISEVAPFLGQFLHAKCVRLGYCPEAKGCGRMPSKKEVLEGYRLACTPSPSIAVPGQIKLPGMDD